MIKVVYYISTKNRVKGKLGGNGEVVGKEGK